MRKEFVHLACECTAPVEECKILHIDNGLLHAQGYKSLLRFVQTDCIEKAMSPIGGKIKLLMWCNMSHHLGKEEVLHKDYSKSISLSIGD